MLRLVSLPLLLLGACAVLTTRRVRRPLPDPPAPADEIVVFGAGVLPDGRPCAELRERLEHAARLHRAGWAPRVLCSGGAREVAAMRETLLGRVPEPAVAVDARGVSTRATLAGLPPQRRVLLVSSPWHAHRIRAEARRQGLRARVCPAPASPLARNPRARRRQIAREVLASWWYAVSST